MQHPQEQPEQPVPLARAAALAGVSVQAIRQRIRRGSMIGVEVEHEGATIQGVALDELRAAYGELTEPEGLGGERQEEPRPDIGEQRQDGQRSGQRHGQAEQRDREPEQRQGEEEQREGKPEQRPEQPGTGLQAVEMAVQAWRDTREALVSARHSHAAELARVGEIIEHERGGRASAVRWGRGVAAAFLVVAGLASWSMVTGERRVAAAERAASSAVAPSVERLASSLAEVSERAARAELERDLLATELETLRLGAWASKAMASAALRTFSTR